MDRCVMQFVAGRLGRTDIEGRRILEVGSAAVQGAEHSVRPSVEALSPESYLGVDIADGPHVDEICDAVDLEARYGPGSFDVVISTEMLEHVRDWRTVISNLKRVVAPGGLLLITTRSRGMPYHAWPGDYWRYEREDMRRIFSDFDVIAGESDPETPGVLVLARRPEGFVEQDLSSIALFSMVRQRRALSFSERDERLFQAAYLPVRLVRNAVPPRWKRLLKRTRLSRENRIQARTFRP